MKASVRGANVHPRGRMVDGVVLPLAEADEARIGVLGFDFEMAQTLSYTSAVRCDGAGRSGSP